MGPIGVQIDLDNTPGHPSPAIVRYCGHTATYWAAWDTLEVDGVALPTRVWEWLDSKFDEMNEFLFGKSP